MSYTYQKIISTDFPNQKVDVDVLFFEIQEGGITSAVLLHVTSDDGDDICELVFDVEPSAGDKSTIDSIVTLHEGEADDDDYVIRGTGGIISAPLSSPEAPTVEPQGTTGSTTWGYKVSAFSDTGETLASDETQITNGSSALTSSDYNQVEWSQVAGAVKYGIYRTTSGGSPSSVGFIGEAFLATYLDTGDIASDDEPTENTSGGLIVSGTTVFQDLVSGIVTSDPTGTISNVSTLSELSDLITDATLDDSSASRTDEDAIHTNISGEISGISSEKTLLSDNDLVIIEDSESSYEKKKAKVSNLPGGGSGGLPSATEVGQMLFSFNGTSFSIVKPVVSDCGLALTDDDGHVVVVE